MPDTGERTAAVKGPLTPLELATASVLGGVCVALVIVGWFFPHASALGALAAVPMGVVAHRHRPRALVAAAVAASSVAFLIGGTGPIYGVVSCAVVGGLVGDGKRRGWGFGRTLAAASVLGPALAGVAVGLLAVFASLRRLTLAQITNSWTGVRRILDHVGFLHGTVHVLNRLVATAVRDWWATVIVGVTVGVLAAVIVAWVVLGAVLDRLEWIRAADTLGVPPDDRPIGPVPVVLDGVGFRYPASTVDALAAIDLRVEPATWVGVVGHNGSGKSTLARILAGRPATVGRVDRPGSSGLGRPGGTAIIMQRPETQVLGIRVADDIVWGLTPDQVAGVDVDAALAAVGLSGMGDRDTSTLSGGELQRLAVASALVRGPRLLLSDESTAMVDEAGRRRLTELLARLPAERQMTVVHVTHRHEEVLGADRVIRLDGGRIVPRMLPVPGTNGHRERRGHCPPPSSTRPLLVAAHVSHTYNAATPWAQTALTDLDLTVNAGEGVLVVGGNGSGKSTLAWILAGLTRPSAGTVEVDGKTVSPESGQVALAFQHARLQLQRPTVRSDVRAAAGVSRLGAEAALASVGLTPALFATRRIDQLSGGEQRRAAIAGLLAHRPRVLVLDEPLAGLDEPSRAGLLAVLADLRSAAGLTLLVISHDLEGVGAVCERTVHLDGGRITADDVAQAPAPEVVRW